MHSYKYYTVYILTYGKLLVAMNTYNVHAEGIFLDDIHSKNVRLCEG